MLLLFDIDGTLVRGRPLTHQAALTEAATEVFGLRFEPGTNPVADVEPWGKTDRQILHDVLARADIAAPDAGAVARWEGLACAAYVRLEVNRDQGSEAAELAATAAALERLRDAGHALALVTGNLEPIARRKLDLRGLGGFFPAGQGGFGSDADLRPELVPIARARAGAHPREDTLLIGDTPLDVAAASADGVRCVAIEGKRFAAEALLAAGATATVAEIPDVEAVLATSRPARAVQLEPHDGLGGAAARLDVPPAREPLDQLQAPVEGERIGLQGLPPREPGSPVAYLHAHPVRHHGHVELQVLACFRPSVQHAVGDQLRDQQRGDLVDLLLDLAAEPAQDSPCSACRHRLAGELPADAARVAREALRLFGQGGTAHGTGRGRGVPADAVDGDAASRASPVGHSLHGPQRAASVHCATPAVARRRTPLHSIRAQVRQPHPPIAPGAPVGQQAPLGLVNGGRAPAPRAERERGDEHEKDAGPHEQHRAKRRHPHQGHALIIPRAGALDT